MTDKELLEKSGQMPHGEVTFLEPIERSIRVNGKWRSYYVVTFIAEEDGYPRNYGAVVFAKVYDDPRHVGEYVYLDLYFTHTAPVSEGWGKFTSPVKQAFTQLAGTY